MKGRNKLIPVLLAIPAILWMLIVLLPILILVFISFKGNYEYNHSLPFMPPQNWLNFANYQRTISEGHLLGSLVNSAILVVCGSCLNVMLGSMTAFILNRFEFKGKGVVRTAYVVAAMIPNTLLQVVIYRVMHTLALTGTYGAPIILYALPNILQVWMYLQFMEKIPVSLDESAMMDGASYLRIFTQIIFPLLLPATATVLITQSILIYGDMFTQYLYCSSATMRTVTTALMLFTGPFGTTFNVMASACVAAMLPTILLYLFLQRYIFAGLTSGAVKG